MKPKKPLLRKELKGGKGSSIVPDVDKPQCSVHKKAMVYIPAELVWRCIMTDCNMVMRVKMLGEARPTILRGPLKFFIYEDTPFILFVDSSLLVPIEQLPEGTVVQEGEDTATITMTLPIQEVQA